MQNAPGLDGKKFPSRSRCLRGCLEISSRMHHQKPAFPRLPKTHKTGILGNQKGLGLPSSAHFGRASESEGRSADFL